MSRFDPSQANTNGVMSAEPIQPKRRVRDARGEKMRQSGGIAKRVGAERRRKRVQGEREERRSRVVRIAERISNPGRE